MLIRTCQFCKKTSDRVFNYKGKYLVCDKHFQQIKKFGKAIRTNFEPNEIFKRNGHLELALYRKGRKIIFGKFDAEDLELVKKYRWYLSSTGHIVSRLRGVCIFLHRLVMNCPKGMEVDHIFGDKLDNRKNQLRICSHSDNIKNQKVRTGKKFKGVSYNGYSWLAQITFNYKNFYLGGFDTEIEAARAYDSKAKELFGDFARLNFPAKTSA